MAFFAVTKFAVLLAFHFFEHVFKSTQYITIVIILFLICIIVFVLFTVWTMRNRPRRKGSLQLGNVSRGNKKAESTHTRKSSTPKQQQTTHIKPTGGDISNYIEIDDDPYLPPCVSPTPHSPGLPNIPEESVFSGTSVSDQRATPSQTMAPLICETTAEIGPSGNNGDVKICLTLKSSDVQYQTNRKDANVSRSHSDLLPVRNEYASMSGEATGSGATGRSMERSITLPRIQMTPVIEQPEKAKCMTLGKNDGRVSADLTHEYMPMGSVMYADMDCGMGMNAYEN